MRTGDMVTLSVNIVHTPGYNKIDLTKNDILIDQLNFLAENKVVINILINGGKSDIVSNPRLSSPYIHFYEFKDYRLFLGVARNYLANRTTTLWYIQSDEDDWFSSVYNVLELREKLSEVDTPLAFYMSTCYDSHGKVIRTIPREGEDAPNEFRFYYHYAIDNTVAYHTRKTSILSRPPMNNGVDNIFSYMCSIYFTDATFISLPIYHYNQGDAKMSNESNKSKIVDDAFYYMDKYMTFNIVKRISND